MKFVEVWRYELMGSRGNSGSADIKMFLADKQIKQPSLTLGESGKITSPEGLEEQNERWYRRNEEEATTFTEDSRPHELCIPPWEGEIILSLTF